MNETEFAEKAREAIYQGLFKFARGQGATEAQALVYAAHWGGEIEVSQPEQSTLAESIMRRRRAGQPPAA